jgi:DNA sulfur modification protein DndE
MTTTLTDQALNATYHLSSGMSTKLRRMTRLAGLPSENIISRMAIVESLVAGPISDASHQRKAVGKEIRGQTLLGRTDSTAALLVALVVASEPETVGRDGIKECLQAHWERGLRLLDSKVQSTDVTSYLAEELPRLSDPSPDIDEAVRPGGHGTSKREKVAAAVGKSFGRWPLEVRRLAAMAGRLRIESALEFARDLQRYTREERQLSRVSEAVALEYLEIRGINRMGLTKADRAILAKIAEHPRQLDEMAPRDRAALDFLRGLGLVTISKGTASLSKAAGKLGSGIWE